MSAVDVTSHRLGHLRRLRVLALRSASLRFSMVYDDHSPRCRWHRDAPTIASRRHRVPFSVSAPHLDCVRATSSTPGLDRRADHCRIAGHMSSVEGALLRAVGARWPKEVARGARFPTVLVPPRAEYKVVHLRSWTAGRLGSYRLQPCLNGRGRRRMRRKPRRPIAPGSLASSLLRGIHGAGPQGITTDRRRRYGLPLAAAGQADVLPGPGLVALHIRGRACLSPQTSFDFLAGAWSQRSAGERGYPQAADTPAAKELWKAK
ncbi:hypothetical protein FHX78_113899 [Streptomyces capillispiralis]|uniref:Uncharacterized protein n=1 Tax=Streptomyces capillispiralis TaxID=68182 RepID=A0A561TIG1_9ACTN|nr:hypothetical protein FHX78_113899 [Streptomyces capillispiralis]